MRSKLCVSLLILTWMFTDYANNILSDKDIDGPIKMILLCQIFKSMLALAASRSNDSRVLSTVSYRCMEDIYAATFMHQLLITCKFKVDCAILHEIFDFNEKRKIFAAVHCANWT